MTSEMTQASSWRSEFNDSCDCPMMPARRKSRCGHCCGQIVARIQEDARTAAIEACIEIYYDGPQDPDVAMRALLVPKPEKPQ